MVEIVAAKVCVTIGRLHLKHAVAKFEDGDIECTATEVEHRDFLVLVALVKTVGQRGCCRLVHDASNSKTCNFAGFLGGLTLRIIEVGRHRDNGFLHFLTQIIFGGLLHFLKNHCRNFLRCVFAAVNVDTRSIVAAAHHFVRHALNFFLNLVECLAHEAFD